MVPPVAGEIDVGKGIEIAQIPARDELRNLIKPFVDRVVKIVSGGRGFLYPLCDLTEVA